MSLIQPPEASTGKKAVTALLGSVLSVFFAILGAPFLKVFRGIAGPMVYWGTGLAIIGVTSWLQISIGMDVPLLSLMLAAMWLTIGLYCELENRGRGSFGAALISVLVGTAVFVIVPPLMIKSMGFDLIESLKTQLQGWMNQAGPLWGSANIKAEDIVHLIPALIFNLMTLSLAMALMLDRRIALMMNVRYLRSAASMRLLSFRVPDVLIWLTLVTLFFSFWDTGNEMVTIVASNIFNSLMGIYFFQGLAVLEVSFLVFRIGNLMRFLIYFLIVGQLFFLLSAVGLVDYWADFRRRLRVRKSSDGQNHGEHV